MTILLLLSIAVVTFVSSSRAGPLDLASLPDLQHSATACYKVDPYIAAAASLQEMGRDAACQVMLQAARTNEAQPIIVLCRMLFAKKPASEFRRPMIGAPDLLGDSDYSDWPLEPIEIVDGIPFAITWGYRGGGRPEAADDYLRYCMTNCDWSTLHFQEVTGKQKHDALSKLIASKKWKRPLNPHELEFLSAQIE